MLKHLFGSLALGAALCLATTGLARADVGKVPPPGVSKRVDAIRKRGELRVGVLSEPPWLKENTTGNGPNYEGPAWLLAQAVAEKLGVKVQVVPVSNDTKIPILASGQVDVTIAPLAVTPERQKAVDFATYTNSALCFFGKASDPKLHGIIKVDQLNSPKITIAYFTGTPPETWLPHRLPEAKLRAVTGSGAGAPIEAIMSGRADVAPIDSVAFFDISHKIHGLVSIPPGKGCLASTEMATPIGVAINKGQPHFLAFLQSVADAMHAQLNDEEMRVVKQY